jgi:uncharacterized protein with ParB-like and HNH nuclease domain
MPNANDANYYFNTTPYTLYDFFMKNLSLLIPEYQRNFSWGEDKLEEIWIDIISTEKNNFNGYDLISESSQQPHFLGAVVTEKHSGVINYEEVIDGQQRLITLTILLAVLCDFIEKISDAQVRQSLLMNVSQLIRNYNSSGLGIGNITGRVRLNQENDFFMNHVLLPVNTTARAISLSSINNPSQIQLRIINTIKFFNNKLENHLGLSSQSDYVQKVDRFRITVVNLLTVLHVSVKKEDLAYTIFETLNTRGLDLTQADLIKNKIFKLGANDQDKKDIMNRWNETQAYFVYDTDPQAITKYIRYLYASYVSEAKLTSLHKTISKYLTDTPSSVTIFSSQMKSEAAIYVAIKESSTGNLTTDNLLNEITNILEVTMSYPLLLSGAITFGLNSPEFAKLVKAVRDFCFRYFTISSLGTVAKIEQIMGKTARNLRVNKDLSSAISELQTISADQVFKDEFKIYQARDSALAFYIIYQIELYLSKGSGIAPLPQSPRQHLEHIMPKNPDNNSNDWVHVIKNERYQSFVNRVGNHLILEASINSSIKNKSYDYKVGSIPSTGKTYLDSKLILPHQTGTYLKNGLWDLESIEERQEDLADLAVDVWSLK